MSDQPPPLPHPEDILAGVKTLTESRVAPPHAPLFWRSMAFLVDASLFGLVGYLITTRVLLPQCRPDELAVFNGWMQEIDKLGENLRAATDRQNLELAKTLFGEIWDKSKSPPAGAIEVMAFGSSCMTMIYWLGFFGMELATGGASLGKKIFRQRLPRFPHGDPVGVLDSLLRSCWKAMAVGSVNPIVTLFAIVDAHWPLFNPLRRSLHDLMSRTVVLDARFDEPESKKNP